MCCWRRRGLHARPLCGHASPTQAHSRFSPPPPAPPPTHHHPHPHPHGVLQLHNLYLSAVQAVLPEEAAAAAAVAELAEQATGSWRVMADVQQAALAASLQSEAS